FVSIENFDTAINQGLRNPVMLSGDGILSLFERDSYPGYADLIPEIGEWNTSARKLKKREQLCFFNASSQTADYACAIVIGKNERRYQRLREMFLEFQHHLPVAFGPKWR